MSFLAVKESNGVPFFDKDISSIGDSLKESYLGTSPYPYTVIDDFLPPEILEKVLEGFPNRSASDKSYDRDQERFKSSFDPNDLEDGYARAMFQSFNSLPFLRFIESLTGFQGLLPDPTFEGGGFHETLRGGHLGIHADFNLHRELRLKRRVNLIIYLNKEWDERWGGHLEIWENDMSKKATGVCPKFNRAVIFNTDSDTMHGHPNPLNCPEEESRRSIALYYYTASDLITQEHKEHTTIFKARDGSEDKGDIGLRTSEFLRDITPPLLLRTIRKLKGSKAA